MKRGKQETKKLAGRYFIFGLLNTAIVYAIYEVLALTVCAADNLLPVATIISGVIGVFTGYSLHARWTWRTREMSGRRLGRYFIWNAGLALAIKPVLTWFFELFGFLYRFAFEIFQAIHIPFTQEFVRTTGVFVLMEAVVMVLNFLVYDSFVFGVPRKQSRKDNREEIEVESVRETREEVKRKSEGE